MNPLHAFPSHLLKINFKIKIPFTPRYSQWYFSFGFILKLCMHFYIVPCNLHAQTILIFSIRSENCSTHLAPHYSRCSPPFGAQIILLSTLFSNNRELTRDQISHQYKTRGKIIVLYISVTFFDNFSEEMV